ncbi:site-2 protease family protein [Pelagibacterium montanilacus]|uniref:site-2 protease family protein n=1 Tax=Pelagibacterium montanilacus TaxID=2185280 RepID=UPI000F8E056E|nr:site-2 protease family protein [Pelagibacterium montanilacus]
MSWSFSIGTLSGTQVRIHVTFLLLLAWIGIAAGLSGGLEAAIDGIVLIIAVFACVLAHEFGHVFMARRFGIRTPDITLLPIGGLARLETMPEVPRQEIAVALAGPAVNMVIVLVLVLLLGAQIDPNTLMTLDDPRADFVLRLASINLFLALFNLLPAFPMDGGRVLRALLAMRYPRARATRYAAQAGQISAFAFGLLGLLAGSPILVFVAVFVYLAATAESGEVAMIEAAKALAARDAAITIFESLSTSSTLADAADAIIRTTQEEFPVLDVQDRIAGFVTRSALFKSLQNTDRNVSVRAIMHDDIPLVSASTSLHLALDAMRKKNAPAVGIVTRDGELKGYVTAENIGELLVVRGDREG